MTRTLQAVLVLSLSAAVQAPAQDADSSARGVARLSLLAGDVSVRRGDTGEWVAAAVNAPLLGEDQVLTGANSRAEVQLDYAHLARLSADTEMRLADIENRKYLVRLVRGTMTFRVLRGSGANAEISTPSIAIRPLKKGTYRVSVLNDGSSEVTVRDGEAEIFTPRGSQRLRSGRTLLARGAAEDPEFQVVNASLLDEWDRWNESRDRQLTKSRSYDYVSQDIYGAEDLDGHGRWENTPEYGTVWVPATSEGWAPYRNGRWTWVDYYGWNWISYDPWGWAPYHYGRWINRPNYGWCWWPGRITSRHYWSPGLVAFFGWGGGYGGVSVGIGFGGGFGNWGWVPLAPFETYYPWYGRGYYGGYRNRNYNNVTIVNNTNITNIYRNARVNNGITAVNAGDFGRGSVNPVRVNRNEIERAGVVRGQLPLVPDAASTRLSDREARVAGDRNAGRGNDRFFSTRQATKLDRVPFENQRSAMQEVSRRTFGDPSGETAGRRGGEAAGGGRGSDSFTGRVTGADRSAGRSADAESGGSRRGGDSRTSTAERSGGEEFGRSGDSSNLERGGGRGGSRGAVADSGERGNWRRFGDTTEAGAPADRNGDRDGGRGGDTDRSDRGGWRRLGDSPTSSAQEDRSGSRGGSSDREGSGGWRRLGDSSSAVGSPDRSGGRGERSESTDRGGWRRLGDSSPAAAPDRSGGRGERTENMDRGSWRRFGDSSPSTAPDRGTDRGADRGAGRGASTDIGSWGRFGDSTSVPSDNGGRRTLDRGTGSRGSDSGSWRRMSESPSSIDRGSSGDRGSFGRGSSERGTGMERRSSDGGIFDRGTSSRDASERGNFDRGTFGRGGRGSSDAGSAPRMSAPPVVRERNTPAFGRGDGGFGGRSESRQSAPQMSAPRMERSAPAAIPGGGGGGGDRGGRGGDGGGGGRGEGRGGGGRGR